ncbi:MAG: hypothetical protein K9J30_15380, partial [Bacteroidales bacterium]|nr:hypothetical protein [Bacteroidales bacterium]
LAKTNFKLKYNTALCEKISHMKVAESVIQVDLFILPAPVKEGRSKAFFPFALMLVDASDGRIVGMKMLSPKPDMHTMHESVPQKLLEELEELGFRPERIELHTDLLYFLTKNALKKSYCMSVLQEEMPMVDEARESLVNQLLEGGLR